MLADLFIACALDPWAVALSVFCEGVVGILGYLMWAGLIGSEHSGLAQQAVGLAGWAVHPNLSS